jgi:thiosulfate/3-mercaptopyruvate sulfurtransferase
MRTFAFICFFCFVSSLAMGDDKPILVDSDWLKNNLSDPRVIVLQVSFLKFDYDREHIEGARYLWPGWLGPDSPEGALNVPDLDAATRILRDFGISNDSHIILCHIRNEVSSTARIFLTLEHLGLRGKVSFLNGGLDQWKKAGNAVTTNLPSGKKGNVKLQVASLIVDKQYVLEALKGNDRLVVDARATRYYDGEPTGNPRDGHITGAKNIPFMDLIDQNNLYKNASELETYFTPVAGKDKEPVVYCFIGQTASVVYMAGRMLGYKMKLYDGSMQEWSRIDSLPMETTKK